MTSPHERFQGAVSEWPERARFAARFVRPGLRILDLGCGAMTVERVFAPSAYLPVDLVRRDARTRLLDLNQAALPAAWLAEVDLVVVLGVLEYLDEPLAHLAAIARAGRPVLCSYSPTEFHDAATRAANRWSNALDIAAFERGVREAGFAIALRHIHERQPVWLLVPPGVDAASLLPELERAPAAGERRSLVVAGFLGRGNCGDEAMFQVIHETFAPDFDIVASVDEHGAHSGFWDWYPYNRSRIINQANLAPVAVEPRPAGMLVGGGGLPLAFVADQVLTAQWAEVPCAIAGVDLLLESGSDKLHQWDWGVIARYFNALKLFATRHEVPADVARQLGISPFHGADWSLRLVADTSTEIRPARDAVAVVLREDDLPLVRYDYIEAVGRLMAGLRAQGRRPFFLPFCPEDERFLGHLGVTALAPVERQWWNPRRMKQVIASAGAVISAGRLHPLIFAASTRTPVVETRMPLIEAVANRPKLGRMAEELGIVRSPNVDDTLARFAAGAVRPSDEGKLRAAEARLDAMIAALRRIFRPA
jgi:hypothetical protein